VAMLALNKTRTVDVDMWNYWHFALAGTLVYYSTGSLFFGLLAAAIAAVAMLALNKTRTVDVDMWNYWHFALAGTLVYYST
ncbi:PTS transporter subunit IIC, partial [Klebsiella pneumoniae]|uniref:PTS transporter subunit IIC n=1 Tax=Klebsiella pneumoniae TaxID=573 RepID=UPI00359C9FB9